MEILLSLGYGHPLIPQAQLCFIRLPVPQGIESLLPFTLPNKAYNTLHKSNYVLSTIPNYGVGHYLPTYSYFTHMQMHPRNY